MKNILILAPFWIVKEFTFPLVALAKALNKLDYYITFAHCQQAMKNYCTAMLAKGIKYEDNDKQKILFCDSCHNAAKISSKIYPWETRWIVPAKENKKTNETIISKSILKKIAGYEVILTRKNSTLKYSNSALSEWKSRLNDLQSIIPSALNILTEKKYQFVICYNNLYGIHQLFCLIAKKIKIKNLSLHLSSNMSKNSEYILHRNTFFDFLKKIIIISKKRVITPSLKKNVQNHVQATMFSKRPWAYSPAPSFLSLNNKRKLKINKILVALSSPDEILGQDMLGLLPKKNYHPFKNQIQWLKWVFKLAHKLPNTLFFIRPHPRMFPNKRETAISTIGIRLEALRNKTLPPNVIWPDQENQGSIWDHLGDTTVLFNAWSSVSDVFHMYGIPVFTFFPLYSNSRGYTDFHSSTEEKYEDAINILLNQQKKISKSISNKIYRWLGTFIDLNTFELNWSLPKIFKLLQKITPKNFRSLFDLAVFSFAYVSTDKRKLRKILENI